MWWKQRRPEIVKIYEREVYGRLPKTYLGSPGRDDHRPGKGWLYSSGRETSDWSRGQFRLSANRCEYFHDVVTPAAGKRAGPMLMMFGRSVFPLQRRPSQEEFELIIRS